MSTQVSPPPPDGQYGTWRPRQAGAVLVGGAVVGVALGVRQPTVVAAEQHADVLPARDRPVHERAPAVARVGSKWIPGSPPNSTGSTTVARGEPHRVGDAVDGSLGRDAQGSGVGRGRGAQERARRDRVRRRPRCCAASTCSTLVLPSLRADDVAPDPSVTTSWLSCDASAQVIANVAVSVSAKPAGTVTVVVWSSFKAHVPDGLAPAGIVPVQLTLFVLAGRRRDGDGVRGRRGRAARSDADRSDDAASCTRPPEALDVQRGASRVETSRSAGDVENVNSDTRHRPSERLRHACGCYPTGQVRREQQRETAQRADGPTTPRRTPRIACARRSSGSSRWTSSATRRRR